MAGTFSDGPSLPRSEDSGLGEILEKKAYTATDTAMEEEQNGAKGSKTSTFKFMSEQR